MTSKVYVIEAQPGLIKIGCSKNPESRVATVALHSPVLVRLIAVLEGARAEEQALHRRFTAQRSHNEWFCLVGPMVEWVHSIRGTGVSAIPEWESLRFWSAEERRSNTAAKRSRLAKARWADPEWRAECMRSSARRKALRTARAVAWNEGRVITAAELEAARAQADARLSREEAA